MKLEDTINQNKPGTARYVRYVISCESRIKPKDMKIEVGEWKGKGTRKGKGLKMGEKIFAFFAFF